MAKIKKLVLCDVDKTIIGVDYKPNSSNFFAAIAAIQSDHMLIGLNSDSPVFRMEQWAADFGMRGPIIAELGGVISYNSEHFFLRNNEPWEKLFGLIINRIRLTFPEIRILVCDSTEFIRDTITIDSSDSGWVIMNSLRAVSVACLFRRLVSGRLVIDHGFSKLLATFILSIVEEIKMEGFISKPDINDEYGIMILHKKGASKSQAIDKIRQMFPAYQVYMIGDSMTDFLNDETILQAAVGNASPEYKQYCLPSLVAPQAHQFTQGVEYLLAQIYKI